MKRRQFVRNTILGSGALVAGLPLVAQSNGEPQLSDSARYFINESGSIDSRNLYIIGILAIKDDRTVFENEIAELRNELNYLPKFTYHSTDSYKSDYALRLIEYFMGRESLIYIGQVFKGPLQGNQYQRILFKIETYNQMLQQISEGFNMRNTVVLTKSQGAFGPNRRFMRNFHSEAGFHILAQDTRESELLQLGNFLTGCVYGSIRDNVTNKMKINLIDFLKEMLKIQSFNENISLSQKFYLTLNS